MSNRNNLPSLLVAVEGGDAVGKHTQTERLAQRLLARQYSVAQMSFPRYPTLFGKALKRHLHQEIVMVEAPVPIYTTDGRLQPAPEDPLAFQAIMLMDRAEAAPDIVRSLSLGMVVVLDRWWQSGVMYGSSDGLAPEMLVKAHQILPQAHLNILLDLDPTVAAQRRSIPRDRYERDREKMATVRHRYTKFWTERMRALDKSYAIVDSAQNPDDVEAQIWSYVEPLLPPAEIWSGDPGDIKPDGALAAFFKAPIKRVAGHGIDFSSWS